MKKILAILLSLSLILCGIFTFFSCNDDDNTDGDQNNDSNNGDDENEDEVKKVKYTVSVEDEDGNAVVGAVVEIESIEHGKSNVTTGDDGKAELELTETVLGVYANIKSLPEGYGKGSAKEIVFKSSTTADFTVVKQVKYSAKVVDGSGAALAGIEVQVCVGDVCNTPITTDANGEAYYYINPTDEAVKLQINGLIDKVPDDAFELDVTTGSYICYYAEDVYEITVTLSAK